MTEETTPQDEPRLPAGSETPPTAERPDSAEQESPESPESQSPEPESPESPEPEFFESAPAEPGSSFPGESLFPDDEPEPEPVARRGVLRTAGLVGARLGTGIIVLAVVGATIAAAALLPFPRISSVARSTVVTPVPSAEQVVCPGGLLQLSNSEGSSATKSSTVGAAGTVSAASSGTAEQRSFASSDASTGGTLAAPQLLSTAPVAAGSKTPTLLSGAQSQSISTSQIFGIASASCAASTGDLWLAGGSTSVGRTTLLTIANPSEVTATASIEIFGENGAISAPGMDGILIAPHGQRVLSLAGFAPGLESPVVHVHSTGGQVVASLQQSTVRGLEPGGVDIVDGQATPTKRTVIPGVVFANTTGVQARLGQDGFDDLAAVLRIYVPGAKTITAHVSVISENGRSKGTNQTASLQGGRVTDLPIDDLSNGTYTIVITTPVAVVASARVSTVGGATVAHKADFAWFAPASPLVSNAQVSVASLPIAATATAAASRMATVLHLDNPTSAAVHVTLRPIGGASRVVTIPAGTAVALRVVGGVSYQLSSFRTLYASVSGTSNGGITGYTVGPAEQASTPLRIFQ
jgi:hypothetical protein